MNAKRFFPGAVKWAGAGSQIDKIKKNPYALIATTLGGGLIESLQGMNKGYNKEGYHDALMRYNKGTMNQTRQTAREMNAQMGASMAGRGYNDTKLATFMTNLNTQKLYGRTNDQMNNMRAALDMELAHTDNLMELRDQRDARAAWGDAGDMVFAGLMEAGNEQGMTTDQLNTLVQNYKWLKETFPDEDWSHLAEQIQRANNQTEPGGLSLENLLGYFGKRPAGNQPIGDLPKPDQISGSDMSKGKGATSAWQDLKKKYAQPEAPKLLDNKADWDIEPEPTTKAGRVSMMKNKIGGENYAYFVPNFFTEDEFLDIFTWDSAA